MNKIEVTDKNEIIMDIDGIDVTYNSDTLEIFVKKDQINPITFINETYKKVIVNIEDNVVASFFEIKSEKSKDHFDYQYLLGNNSKVIINKFYYMSSYTEDNIVNLNGYESNVLFNFSVMSFGTQKYNITINHNNKKTISNIYNHGVTFNEGTLELTVNGYVHKGMSDSVLNQDNKIMTMGTGVSVIKPNLFIDENMVEARHGASIGRFNEDEIFYLAARGIPEEEGYRLLMKGFLLGIFKLDAEMEGQLVDIVEKLGR